MTNTVFSSKKKIFWIVIFFILSVIISVQILRPALDSEILTIVSIQGETKEIIISDLLSIDSVDFNNISNQSDAKIINDWYEKYVISKRNNLLKVFALHQIISLSGVEDNLDFPLTFESIDGGKVLTYQVHGDSRMLILLTLEKDHNGLSLRLIFPEDTFSQRWLKNVIKITIG